MGLIWRRFVVIVDFQTREMIGSQSKIRMSPFLVPSKTINSRLEVIVAQILKRVFHRVVKELRGRNGEFVSLSRSNKHCNRIQRVIAVAITATYPAEAR